LAEPRARGFVSSPGWGAAGKAEPKERRLWGSRGCPGLGSPRASSRRSEQSPRPQQSAPKVLDKPGSEARREKPAACQDRPLPGGKSWGQKYQTQGKKPPEPQTVAVF